MRLVLSHHLELSVELIVYVEHIGGAATAVMSEMTSQLMQHCCICFPWATDTVCTLLY